jgi:hypothetical protein
MLIYHQLTKRFNAGRLRAVMCSGQAVVMHRLAITSKDGDWIVREIQDDLDHILGVLAECGATYRFGAPLDTRWMAGGWSAHFEFHHEGLRVRTDFFCRPPRLQPSDLNRLWEEHISQEIPFVGLRELALMKMTMREKDYPIIGELARRLPATEDQFLFSRSARDLIALAESHPVPSVILESRPLLAAIKEGEDALAAALDHERRQLMKADEARLARYKTASEAWETAWPALNGDISTMPLATAHQHLIGAAQTLLPYQP